MVAPLYNLVLVAIVIILYIYLLKIKTKNFYALPWILIFIAICIFIVEEIITVLSNTGIYLIPHFIFGFFEMAMITLFIYALLLQREYIKKLKK